MKVIGLDPGFASFGVAVVDVRESDEHVISLSVVHTQKSAKKQRVLATEDNVRRARVIASELKWLPCRKGMGRIGAVCAEAMSFPRSSSVAGKMCLAWGVVAAWLHEYCLPLVQASPQAIKLAVCGSKQASKNDVQAALVKRYGAQIDRLLERLPRGEWEHPLDALAAVVACLDSDVIRAVRKAG